MQTKYVLLDLFCGITVDALFSKRLSRGQYNLNIVGHRVQSREARVRREKYGLSNGDGRIKTSERTAGVKGEQDEPGV